MGIKLYEEYKEILRRVARESGVSYISALRLSRCVLCICESDKVDIVKALLHVYLPGNGFVVRLESQEERPHSDILIHEAGGVYYWNDTEENLLCLSRNMSDYEKELYASYGLF